MPKSYFEEIADRAIEKEKERKKKGILLKYPNYILDEKLREKMEPASYEIHPVRGHYEVYRNGKRCGSADKYSEALADIPN